MLFLGEVPTKTLYAVPPDTFVDDTASSHVNVKFPSVPSEAPASVQPKPTTETSPSSYFSAQAIDRTPKTTEYQLPCEAIGKPCSIFQVKQTSGGPTKFAENSVNCTIIDASSMKAEVDATHSLPTKEYQESFGKPPAILKRVKDAKESQHTVPERQTCYGTCEAVCVLDGNSCTVLKTNLATSSRITNRAESFPNGVPCREYDSGMKGARSYPADAKTATGYGEQTASIPGAETLISSLPLDQIASSKQDPQPKSVIKVEVNEVSPGYELEAVPASVVQKQSRQYPVTSAVENYVCPPTCYREGIPCQKTKEGTLFGGPTSQITGPGYSSAIDAAKYVSDILLETVDEGYNKKGKDSIVASERGTH